MDAIDRKILQHVQLDSRQSIERLASAVGLSTAATQKRLRKLKDNKVILKEVAVLDPKLVGRAMTFIIMVELEREKVSDLHLFKRKIASEPLIQQSFYVTGQADFILVVRTSNMEEFETLTHRLFYNDANVRKFTTSVAFGPCNIETSICVEDLPA